MFVFDMSVLLFSIQTSLRRSATNDRNPRVIFVSSGGMYNTKFPEWGLVSRPGLMPAREYIYMIAPFIYARW